jgi:cysteinyl-tRNA synthetase
LKIYNSLTGQKEEFVPIEPGKVRLYVCGMTVYDYCHVGHARVMVVFDMVVRYLRARGFDVTYVRNITDIDDKIIKRAQEMGETIEQLTERFIGYMNEDAAALGVMRPDVEPRATQNIPQMLKMIQALLDKGYAYRAATGPERSRRDGDVYYDVSRFAGYGKLSGKRIDDLRVGGRVEVDDAKDDPLDFVLWKAAKPGEPQWDAPWGPGRPGWHIECSAMATDCLGNHFDIHGGGQDLQFPHHENEVAQSEGASGETFVNYWMHNGFVRVNEEKMSKSLGNFFTVREVLKHFRPEQGPEILRFFILNSHYRSPLNYSLENLESAKAGLTRLYLTLRAVKPIEDTAPDPGLLERFDAAMEDDFNTPQAFALLFEISNKINKIRNDDRRLTASLAATLKYLGKILGILQNDSFFKAEVIAGTANLVLPLLEVRGLGGFSSPLSDADILHLIKLRTDYRNKKDWAWSDQIRDFLSKEGIILEDRATGETEWRRG